MNKSNQISPSLLPTYDELPVAAGAPKGSSWGIWGPHDRLGCLNLLTADRVLAGVGNATDGKVFNLNLELELPHPPLFSRSAFEHIVHGSGIGHDDELTGWNTQRSSQWDGFRHLKHPAFGFYNGVADEEHGIQYWARVGIVGQAVLADVARWRDSVHQPIQAAAADEITIDDLSATLEAQETHLEAGDILLVRTGWLSWYRSLDANERAGVAEDAMKGTCGLQRGRATAAGLWNFHIAAIAADNPSLEVMPFGSWAPELLQSWRADPEAAADTMLHFSLLGLLGIPIGELFDLDALADDCHQDGRYRCLLTSSPLNLEAGVATPPNALALK